jgi:hypothetical protein
MGTTQRFEISGQSIDINLTRDNGDLIPSPTDRRRLANLGRCPYKPFPFPVGTRFGELTILEWVPGSSNKGRAKGWHPIVQCSCGWKGQVDRYNLKEGRTTRCNTCAKITTNTKRYWLYKAAMDDDTSRTRLLDRLSACIGRCHNETNAQFLSYGGRGITVHPEWRCNRPAFLQYIQTLEGWDNPDLQMDRVDNDKGYEPGNIRFVSAKTNVANRRQVNQLTQRIQHLEQELADLRSSLSRPA